jgi:uroporphyrinogen decarboxylase
MDFVKIQYETVFPRRPEIATPEDWAGMPLYDKTFYADQLSVAENLIKAAKNEALVIMTLYSPFMCAKYTSDNRIRDHIRENPEKAKRGMEIITESLMIFVKECIKLGIDGFYHSSQGRERSTFADKSLFDTNVKPYDLTLMEEIDRSCIFNILHVCDYHDGYDDLTPFLDYPGHVVNCSLELGDRRLTGKEVARMFNRPFMGGLDRKGVITTGSQEDVKRAVEAQLRNAPEKFILAADCTVPSETDWDNLKTAISTAHAFKRD